MRSLLVSVCLLVCVSVVFAQSDRGSITGTVSDVTAAVIPGAEIAATNTQTGARYETVSTETGNYTLAQLPAGVYELAVELPGFKKYVRQGITVLVAQTLRIDVSLQVGAATEEVTITADAPLLRTESGDLSHNLATERLNSLPLLGIGGSAAGSYGIRNPLNVTQLIPGTYYVANTELRINGAPSNSQAIRIEGQDATNRMSTFSTSQASPSVDSIQEVSVQTSNYAAEFGQTGGGLFNYTMKSGTNQFHGSVYDYLVNEALNAGQPFTQVDGKLARPRSRRNNYGFNVSGPVLLPKYDGHNKTFFFFNFEEYREKVQVNNQSFTIPTVAYRNGDFSQTLTGRVLAADPLGRPIVEGTIYDPATTRIVNGQVVRDPFPNNRIPLDRMDPVALKVQSLIPPPDTPDLVNNFHPSYPSQRVTTIPAIKIDHNLSARSKLSFYWSRTETATQYSPARGASDGLPLPITAARGSFIPLHTERLNFDHTLSPTLLLHVGVGYQFDDFKDDSPVLSYDAEKELGLKGGTLKRNFPQFTSMVAARGGMKDMGPGAQSRTLMVKPTGNASVIWVKNNHTYKGGMEFRLEGYPAANYQGAAGMFTFTGDQTGLPSTQGQNLQGGTIGFPYASFLLGSVNNGNISSVSNVRVGKTQWGFFIQDTWKVTRTFTLDYGLRYDYSTYLKEQYGRFPNFSATTPNPTAGGRPGASIFEGEGPGRCNCTFAKNYPYAFGPRLGAAYQITPRNVLRLGWGIAYTGTANSNGTTGLVRSLNPFSSPAFGEPAMRLKDGIPLSGEQIAWPKYDAGLYPTPGTLEGAPREIDLQSGRPARMMQWSIGLQHELFPNLVVEAAYVGNRGVWWQANALKNTNALTPEQLASFGLDINNANDRTLLNSRLNSPTAAQRGFNKPPYPGFPLDSTVAQSLRPFPQFGTLTPLWAPLGKTWYDSLQAKATKRLSRGLDLTATYTWQKELTLGTEADSGGIAVAVNDVFNRAQNKYISGYSRPQMFVLAANYQLPRLNTNKVLSLAIGDWQIGAVLQYASGQPIRVPAAQNQLNSVLFRNTFADRVPGEPLFTKDLNCHCFDPNKEFVLNPKAWVDPPAGRFGVSPAYYNDYRYQRRPLESINLGRTFRITEKASLQVRVDFDNVFNRTYVNDPDSTNAKATQTVDPKTGQVISGFGRINTATVLTSGVNALPRQGTIVARLRF